MHVKYLIKNQNGGMAATLMTCHRRFYIWSSVSGRWFEIFSLLLVVNYCIMKCWCTRNISLEKKCQDGRRVAIFMTF